MKTINRLLVLLACLTGNAFANSNLEICLATAKQMNAQLPRKIDFLTTLEVTSCLQEKGKIYFQYVHLISDPTRLPKDINRKAKDAARTQYCYNPQFANALNHFILDFYYLDNQRRPLHTFSLSKSDC